MKKTLRWVFPGVWFFLGSFVCKEKNHWVAWWIGAVLIAIFSGLYTDTPAKKAE